MPCCNGTDTGFNVTRHESGPTSDWWYVAGKFGEPLLWGKANDNDRPSSIGAPSTLSKDMYSGCRWVSRRLDVGTHSDVPGQ